jgi:hypothetical protein
MHYCVYVFIGTKGNIHHQVQKAMAPFRESAPVVRLKYYLPESGIRAMADCVGVSPTDLEELARRMHEWNRCEGGVDEIGLFAWLHHNPDGKWDWYELGGQWNGYIRGGATERFRRRHRDSDNVIVARELAASNEVERRLPFAVVVPSGQWVSRSEFDEAEWIAFLKHLLLKFPGRRVACVDIHQ